MRNEKPLICEMELEEGGTGSQTSKGTTYKMRSFFPRTILGFLFVTFFSGAALLTNSIHLRPPNTVCIIEGKSTPESYISFRPFWKEYHVTMFKMDGNNIIIPRFIHNNILYKNCKSSYSIHSVNKFASFVDGDVPGFIAKLTESITRVSETNNTDPLDEYNQFLNVTDMSCKENTSPVCPKQVPAVCPLSVCPPAVCPTQAPAECPPAVCPPQESPVCPPAVCPPQESPVCPPAVCPTQAPCKSNRRGRTTQNPLNYRDGDVDRDVDEEEDDDIEDSTRPLSRLKRVDLEVTSS